MSWVVVIPKEGWTGPKKKKKKLNIRCHTKRRIPVHLFFGMTTTQDIRDLFAYRSSHGIFMMNCLRTHNVIEIASVQRFKETFLWPIIYFNYQPYHVEKCSNYIKKRGIKVEYSLCVACLYKVLLCLFLFMACFIFSPGVWPWTGLL